jgi:coronin-1B/1C/6
MFGTLNKKEKAYQNIKPNLAGEGNFLAASVLYTAVPISGGGGPVMIIRNGCYEKYTTTIGKLTVHKNPVLDCAFAPYDHQLLATGDDVGQVNVTRLPDPSQLPEWKEKVDSKYTEAYASIIGSTPVMAALPDCHSKKVSILGWNPNVRNILGSCGFDNTVKIFDVEACKNIASFDQPDQPYYFDWNSDGTKIAVMRKDKTVAICDPRDQKSEIKAEGLDAKPGRCIWADPARKLIVTGVKGGSRVIALYDPKKFSAPLSVQDVDQGGSVLTPYYDPDTSVLFLPGKGDATLRYYEILEKDDAESYCYPLADFRDNESSKGGCFLPKQACDTTKCEVAIFYRLMRDWISPVSLTVPRKSDQFQADLFPDTYSGPSLEAKEYLSHAGKDHKPAIKRSMKPGTEAPSAPSRTKADVERELEAAKNRVKALEAELANFK